MRITKFPKNEKTYSSNVYLIRGDFNSIKDVNTLIDAGGDDSILAEIEKINTGTGKKEIEQIIFTHDHFDHTIGAKFVKEKYKSNVLSFSKTKYT
ncbi:MAG: MBL fold metallo-hydrolase, partial [Candidatus Cloacimonadota bacterium]|nr:MBL fold metallo-hydrolase [Candidatus Cloacimonadota bacterium]